MKVKLLKDARIWHKAGEIIEVSPEECFFLTSTDGAVEVSEAVKASAVKSEVEVPESKVIENVEVPEKKVVKKTAVRKAAAKKK